MTKQKAKNKPLIYARPSKKPGGPTSWQVKLRENGVNLSKTFKTEGEANNWIILKRAKIITGESLAGERHSETLLANIFEDYILNGGVDSKKAAILRVVQVELASVKLQQLNTRALENYVKIKLGQEVRAHPKKKKDHPLYKGGKRIVDGKEETRTYAPATVRKVYYAIRNALAWHAKEYEYNFNSKPFDECTPPPSWEAPRERRLSEGELEKLLTEAATRKHGDEIQDVINFQIYSCMRIGETLKMTWGDIRLDESDPDASYIFVPKKNQKTRNHRKATDREVAMRPELFDMLRNRVLPRRNNQPSTNLVFPSLKNSSYAGGQFRSICDKTEVNDLSLHDLRHEGISWLFENTSLTDIEISTISGHIELDTLKRYAKLRPKKIGAKIRLGLSIRSNT
jgi:integrase